MEPIGLASFSETLKMYRKQKKLTQRQLAAKLGVHYNTIGAWERGDYLPETKGMVLELANQLDLNELETRNLLEASLTAISNYWNIPYQRNPFFAGHEEDLQHLHEVLSTQQNIVRGYAYALCGMGGIGKTQLAVEYAYRHFADYSAIFWLVGETVESMIAGLLTLADVLSLPEKKERDEEKTVAAVLRWLNTHRDWLLIVDNVEDYTKIKSMLPVARQGALLFTTRLQTLGTLAQSIEVQPFPLEEATQFLLRRSGYLKEQELPDFLLSEDYAAARELASAMDGLPLALDQAGAYIEETRCGMQEFLQLYQTYTVQLLRERDERSEHPPSVVSTFALSFERLLQKNSEATELLILCCFLAPDAIPEQMIVQGASLLGDLLQPSVSHPLRWNAMLRDLLSYSLIRRHASSKMLSVHRLVQAVLRDRLDEEMRREWTERVSLLVDHSFAGDLLRRDIQQWFWYEKVLPHVLQCISLGEQEQVIGPVFKSLLSKAALYLKERVRYAEAGPLFQKLYTLQEREWGTEHVETAVILTEQASLLLEQGRPQQAQELYQRSFSILERDLVEDDLRLAEPLFGLARIYRDTGKFQEAIDLYERAQRLREQHLGSAHPDVATLLNSLAMLYENLGEYDKAESLFTRAKDIFEQELGPGHPEVSGVLTNLANLYSEQGQHEKAVVISQQVLRMEEEIWGFHHPNIAFLLNNMAGTYYFQGKLEEAEFLAQRALLIREQSFGLVHPDVAYTLHILANIYERQKRYAEAEQVAERSLSICEQSNGLDSHDAALHMNTLAAIYIVQGKDQEAEPLVLRTLHILEKSCSAHVVNPLQQLARLYVRQERYAEAAERYQQVITFWQQRDTPADFPALITCQQEYQNLLQQYKSEDFPSA